MCRKTEHFITKSRWVTITLATVYAMRTWLYVCLFVEAVAWILREWGPALRLLRVNKSEQAIGEQLIDVPSYAPPTLLLFINTAHALVMLFFDTINSIFVWHFASFAADLTTNEMKQQSTRDSLTSAEIISMRTCYFRNFRVSIYLHAYSLM